MSLENLQYSELCEAANRGMAHSGDPAVASDLGIPTDFGEMRQHIRDGLTVAKALGMLSWETYFELLIVVDPKAATKEALERALANKR